MPNTFGHRSALSGRRTTTLFPKNLTALSMAAFFSCCSVSVHGASASIEEQLLLDTGGVRITARELLDDDGFMGPRLKLFIENNSEKDLTIQARSVSVNGYMVDTVLSADVTAGKKTADDLLLLAGDLKTCGIETIADLEFSFHIFESASWSSYLDSEQIRIETSAQKDYPYSFDDSGDVLYEDSTVKIVKKGLSGESSWFGPAVLLYMENLSDSPITVQCSDTSVNGYMVDALLSEEITPGRHAIASMTLSSSDLTDNGISEPEVLETSFHIFHTDSYETILDTEQLIIDLH